MPCWPTIRGSDRLAASGVTSLIVESTPAELAALVTGDVLDRADGLHHPDVVTRPGSDGPPSTGLSTGGFQLQSVTLERLGETVVISGYVPGTASAARGRHADKHLNPKGPPACSPALSRRWAPFAT